MAKKNNWKNLEIYLNPDFKNRYSNTEEEKYYFRTIWDYAGGLNNNLCQHCIEINYLLQRLGNFEGLSPTHWELLLRGYNKFIEHLNFIESDWTKDLEKLNPKNIDKILLYQGFVILEQYNDNYKGSITGKYYDLKIGGSSTQSIYVFRELEKRGLVYKELLSWTFQNRTNNRIPFGKPLYPSNHHFYKKFIGDFNDEAIIQDKNLDFAKEKFDKEELKEIKNNIAYKVRQIKGKAKNDILYARVKTYLETKPDVLQDIINERLDFPISLLPTESVERIINGIDDLKYAECKKLISLIPSNVPPKIRVLKRLVIKKLKKGLAGFIASIIIRIPISKKIKRKNDESKKYWTKLIRGNRRRKKILARRERKLSVLKGL